jgi:ubiquinone/menaquinone biosynthesis C-methylase UbiE
MPQESHVEIPAIEQPWFSPYSRDEYLSFIATIASHPVGTSEVDWQTRALNMSQARGRPFTGRELSAYHASVCKYFAEPESSLRFYFTRAIYEYDGIVPLTAALARRVRFLNLGYEHLAERVTLQLEPEDRPFRHNIQLYTHMLGPTDVREKDVVEVGSGLGGGADFLFRAFGPRSIVGIDGSRKHVDACSEAYPAIRFMHGHAAQLPLQDNCCDLVLSVESSHAYTNLDAFLSEVARVLRSGGRLFLTDLIPKHRVLEYICALERHFSVEKKADCTKNVTAALEISGPAQIVRMITCFLGASSADASNPFIDDRFSRVQIAEMVKSLVRCYLPVSGSAPFALYGNLKEGAAIYADFVCAKR